DAERQRGDRSRRKDADADGPRTAGRPLSAAPGLEPPEELAKPQPSQPIEGVVDTKLRLHVPGEVLDEVREQAGGRPAERPCPPWRKRRGPGRRLPRAAPGNQRREDAPGRDPRD